MNALWIVLGLGFVGALVRMIGWTQEHSRPPDLGYVSHQWIAEHRLSQADERQR